MVQAWFQGLNPAVEDRPPGCCAKATWRRWARACSAPPGRSRRPADRMTQTVGGEAGPLSEGAEQAQRGPRERPFQPWLRNR